MLQALGGTLSDANWLAEQSTGCYRLTNLELRRTLAPSKTRSNPPRTPALAWFVLQTPNPTIMLAVGLPSRVRLDVDVTFLTFRRLRNPPS